MLDDEVTARMPARTPREIPPLDRAVGVDRVPDVQASAAKLREFHERDLSDEDVVAVVLDGKTFAERRWSWRSASR